MKHLIPLSLCFALGVLAADSAIRAQIPGLPSYQVVFDDFEYTPATYAGGHGPNSAGTTWNSGNGTLFGANDWEARPGTTPYAGQAWFFHNWPENCRLHGDAEIEVSNLYYGSLLFRSGPGFARFSGDCNRVPPQIKTGFVRRTGTWGARLRLQELENLVDLTQTFWLHSGHVALLPNGDKQWSEFNHEWNNWFGTQGGWPSTSRDTHMANGIAMYDFQPSSTSQGTIGGVPLRNPRIANMPANDFKCFWSPGHPTYYNVSNVDTCMRWLVEDQDGNPGVFVDLMIQYDGDDLKYTAVMPNYQDGYYVRMERTEPIGRVSQLLSGIFTQHTADSDVVLPSGQNVELEIDWFYYASDPDVDYWDMENQVEYFRNQNWGRVNLDGDSLAAPAANPWVVQKLFTPNEASGVGNLWIVQPTPREHNRHTVRWRYRFTYSQNGPWSSWRTVHGGLQFTLAVFHKAEVAVSVDDYYDGAVGFTPEVCRGYNFSTGLPIACE